jgi:hypothetical protein
VKWIVQNVEIKQKTTELLGEPLVFIPGFALLMRAFNVKKNKRTVFAKVLFFFRFQTVP